MISFRPRRPRRTLPPHWALLLMTLSGGRSPLPMRPERVYRPEPIRIPTTKGETR